MRRFSLQLLCFAIMGVVGFSASATKKLPISKAPKDAKVYIVEPKDGATVSSPFTVVFGLKNMGVAPAGVKLENTGHHHLVINAALPPKGKPIPMDDNYKHFGKGNTETELKLKPGKHTLQLVLGDHLHIPHDPMIFSEKISITVK